jgi:hypothetical protein
MILYILKKDFNYEVSYNEPVKIPEFSIYDYQSRRIF